MTETIGPELVLDAYAASSCPVKISLGFDVTLPRPDRQSDDVGAERLAASRLFRRETLDAWATRPGVLDLREIAHRPAGSDACIQAMLAGADVILSGSLPADPARGRTGSPHVLVRAADRDDGRPQYCPVVIKQHRITDRLRPPHPDYPGRRSVTYTTLADPNPTGRQPLDGVGLRIGRRESDFLALAHYYRLLQAVGFASQPLAAVLGTDFQLGEPMLAWVDLSAPVVRTFSRTAPEGWRTRSLLERYDHEHRFRTAVAAAAVRPASAPDDRPQDAVVKPIRVPECRRCPWWAEHCGPSLPDGDLSVAIDSSPLDVREIVALRAQGVQTAQDLAGADLDALLPGYLPEVSHRPGAEGRLRTAARRATMLIDGRPVERETEGPIEVPAAEIEVDFDIETAADGRVYLWGFLITDRSAGSESGADRAPSPGYRAFARFDNLDAEAEAALAVEALGWLRSLVEGPRSVAVYHYSGYEVAMIKDLATRHSPRMDWAADYADRHFVDLLEIVKQHYFGVAGLGLKRIAAESGFHWRDADPNGLSSQGWFADAVHAPDADGRAAAARRVLEYNEDDVLATAEVRRWLRAQ